MSCRQNWKFLTGPQKQAFCDAVIELKKNVPSVLFAGSATHRRYDDYVELHRLAMAFMPSWGHGAPAFYTWHRELLRHFETDLRSIDSTVSIPYWDWTTENGTGAPIWEAAYLGTNGTAAATNHGKVMDGRFAFDAGDWTIHVKDAPSNPDYLRRRFGEDTTATALPTAMQLTSTLSWPDYDLSPWDDMLRPDPAVNPVPWRNFRDFGELVLHNLVHRWCGGTMALATSPNDPIFWLHHCNLDRLWTVWQRQHPGSDPYVPSSGAPLGHNEGDALIFRDSTDASAVDPWPMATTTSAALLNHQTMPGGHWYDTDPPRVTLTTPSVAFTGVPEGPGGIATVTYRAILFDVVPGHCNPVSFQITAGPTAGFGTPLAPEPVPPSDSAVPVKGRVWLSYSTADGNIPGGSVTVQARSTNPLGGTVWSQNYTVNLSATRIPRPRNAVVLVLDRSGSMSEDAGDGHPKVEKLKESVGSFVTMMQPGDGLGIVRFDHEVNRLLSVTDVGPVSPVTPGSGRDQATSILAGSQLNPRGATSIGGGVAEGRQALNDAGAAVPPYDVRAMVVLTDGNENTPPRISGVAGDLDARTFAIGFGTASNVSAPALNLLTQNHNGYLLVTGAITPGTGFRLTKYFLQIQAGVNNQQVVLDPDGELVFGAQHRIPFALTEADAGVEVVVLSPVPEAVDFRLETPGGRIIDLGTAAAEPTIEVVEGQQLACFRFSLPALPSDASGTHAGTWHALLSLTRDQKSDRLIASHGFREPALSYSLLVHAYSALRLAAEMHQDGFEPGARIRITASLSEYGVPVRGRAHTWAEIVRSDGSALTLTLHEEEDQFTAEFPTTVAGVYTLRVRAIGTTFRGRPFQRETTLTAAVFAGGNRESAEMGGVDGERGDVVGAAVCRVLACILGRRVLTPRYRWYLKLIGINLDALEECVRRNCEDHPTGPQPAVRAAADVSVAAATPSRETAQMPDGATEHAGIATLQPAEPRPAQPVRRREHEHAEHFPLFPALLEEAEQSGRRIAAERAEAGSPHPQPETHDRHSGTGTPGDAHGPEMP